MEYIMRKSSMVMCISVLVIGLGCTPSMAAGSLVPAMFVFGDSMADAGTNNYVRNALLRGNIPPYGVTFFHYPTGRFTDGRNAFDFIAMKLRLSFLPPFLQPEANFMSGINFASGGSGFLDDTRAEFNVLNMAHQIAQFESYSEFLITTLGAERAASYLARSLFTLSSGGNDLLVYLENLFHITVIGTGESGTIDTDAPGRVSVVLNKIEQHLTKLYLAGARKFLLWDVIPLGCAPRLRYVRSNITGSSGEECFAIPNFFAQLYNSRLKLLVDKLNKKLPGAKVTIVNTFDYLTNLIKHGEDYGLTETKSACCGSGNFNAELGCGHTTPPGLHCGNRLKSHLFWDGVHPTENVFRMIADDIWNGNSSIIYPINLSQLIRYVQEPGSTSITSDHKKTDSSSSLPISY